MESKRTRLPECLLSKKPYSFWREKFIDDACRLIEESRKIEPDTFHNKSGLHISYQSFLRFFKIRQQLTLDDFIIATQFTYGWMPTINDMYGDPRLAFDAFSKMISAEFDLLKDAALTKAHLNRLIPATNNSLVGASKLLHFARPNTYAVWDSQVFRYFYPGKQMSSNKLTQLPRYLQYHELLRDLSKDVVVTPIIEDLEANLKNMLPFNYQSQAKLTSYRCIEFVMYSTAIMDGQLMRDK